MSLSTRGLLIALPIIALVIGVTTWFSYSSAIADFESRAAFELGNSTRTNAEILRRKVALIEEVESKAIALANERLDREPDTRFDRIAKRAPDGASHMPDSFWNGTQTDAGIYLSGMAGFFPPPVPVGPRRDVILAAYGALRAMANGLPDEVESLYFFSPYNDLLIYAPDRSDDLKFYRSAPADFDFQDSEFNLISLPEANPEARLRCTSLQNPAYDEEGRSWTTGCMTPLRRDGNHLGAWGVSIPLAQMTAGLRSPPEGAFTVIVDANARLIHHSAMTRQNQESLSANLDLMTAEDPTLSAIGAFIATSPADGMIDLDRIEAQIAIERLSAPEWYVLTVMPRSSLSPRAWSISKRVILIDTLGALVLALALGALFHFKIARRISVLSERADRVSTSTTDEARIAKSSGDEIARLETSFTSMERRLEQAQTREHQSFDMLVDAAQGYAMLLFDAHGALVRANRGARDLIGDQGIGKLEQALRSRLSGDQRGEAELPGDTPRTLSLTNGAGEARSVEEMLVPLRDDGGATFGFAYVAHDLTDLLRKERELEESLLFLELAQSSAEVGHFALDPQTMDVALSTWIRGKLGIEEEAVPLVELAGYFAEETRSKTMEDIAHAILSKEPFFLEAVAIAKDATRMSVTIQGTAAFALENGGDQPIGYYGVVRDVTEERAAQQALMRARDEAEAEAQARSDLLAVVSHEIRTPIAGILGLIDQIRREPSSQERERALAMIENSSEALLQTLDATLQRRRLEREEAAGSERTFRPIDLAERVAGLFRPLGRRKGIAIEVRAHSELEVLGYEAKIQQILANLVSNAVKFTAVGSVTIEVGAPDGQSDIWSFRVEDTGPGIAKGRLKKIFEPFTGSAADTLGRKSGSGLGLSIAHDIAKELGGELTAENRIEGGTRISLMLPLQRVSRHSEDTEKGTIAIALSQASLALQVEIAAAAHGYRAVEGDAAPDILVTDSASTLEGFEGRCAIEVMESEAVGSVTSAAHIVQVSASDILDRLPDLLGECDDREA